MSQPTSGTAVGTAPRAAATVFFDGACPVCRREISWYRGMVGADAVAWVDVAADLPAAELPAGKDRQALLGRFTVTRQDGAVVDGAAGFVALWRALGPTRRIGAVLDRWPFVALGEIAYRLFLRLRRLWRRHA
ncbi:MAG: DUF393 domain-containing protein [Pseudomonadota bacterium]